MAGSLLIVDDSATMRKIVMRTVRMAGLTFDKTEEAGNGKEALEKLGAGAFDVMLCDINMPEMSGPELVKEVRKIDSCSKMRIIMVSTESSQEMIDQLIADGADGYITKPFTPDKFREKVAPLVSC